MERRASTDDSPLPAGFRQLADLANDAICVVQDRRYAYVNPATARLLGYDTTEEVLALSFADFMPPEDLAIMGERTVRILAGEILPPFEYRGRRKDGTMVTVELSSVRIDYGGRPAMLGIGRDVGERKRLQAQVQQSDRMAAVGTLAASIAHEINNPLAYISLHLQLLRRNLPDRLAGEAVAETLRALDEALEGTQRVESIVRDLLSFARVDDDGDARSDCTAVLSSTVRLATTSLRHKARVHCDIRAVPPVACNESRLGQVFLNLVSNAMQAFDHDDADVNVVRVSCREEGARVRVDIEDNGRGIPDDHQHRIFEPFFTTKPHGSGTGLGLPITRSILEGIGGTIRIDSELGRGTAVRVTLPTAGAANRAASASGGCATGPRKRILIVDDEVMLARALSQAISPHHDATAVCKGADALTLLDEESFDLILCDLLMPDITGWELEERLVSAKARYADRFLFMTGGAATETAARFVSQRQDDVIAKPIDLDVLLSEIARRLARQR